VAEVLRWTPLRHQMLTRVRASPNGDLRKHKHGLYYSQTADLTAKQQRALRQLHEADVITEVDRTVTSAALTPSHDGFLVLARWNAKHPEVADA